MIATKRSRALLFVKLTVTSIGFSEQLWDVAGCERLNLKRNASE